MQQAFFIIIVAVGAVYAFLTKQGKTGLGFLILAVSFTLAFPNLVNGVWVDVLNALSLIVFLIGATVIVWKRPIPKIEKPTESLLENNESKTI